MANLGDIRKFQFPVREFAHTLSVPSLDIRFDQNVGPMYSAMMGRLSASFKAVVWEKQDVSLKHEESITYLLPKTDRDYLKEWFKRTFPRAARWLAIAPTYTVHRVTTSKVFTGKMTVACPHQQPHHDPMVITTYTPIPFDVFREVEPK